ncbi:MAG: hypothetical protein JSS78_09020 [Bacteroidetes bacterium]|nr:hypothetical protein [Bacteroidota bacterium]
MLQKRILLPLSLIVVLGCNHDDHLNPVNTGNAMVTWDCNYSKITKDTVLRNLSNDAGMYDYIINCPITISDNATLIIEPGVSILFNTADAGLLTEGNGGLKAIGEQGQPIILSSSNQNKGAWRGIVFSSNSVNNQLKYVYVNYAGSTKSANADEKAAITVPSTNANTKLSITNCFISFSAGTGFWMGDGKGTQSLISFDNNKFTDIELSPIYINAWHLSKINPSLSFSTINQYFISVYGVYLNADLYAINKNVTVSPLILPYRLISNDIIVKDGGNISFDPGVLMEFAAGTGIRTVEANGTTGADASISAVGVAANHVTFRGVISGQGSWKGVALLSGSNYNLLQYCDIIGGGAGTWIPIGGVEYGNVTVYSRFKNAKASIQNCNITNSNTHGIAAKGSGNYPAVVNADIATSNTFSNNAKQPDVYQ